MGEKEKIKGEKTERERRHKKRERSERKVTGRETRRENGERSDREKRGFNFSAPRLSLTNAHTHRITSEHTHTHPHIQMHTTQLIHTHMTGGRSRGHPDLRRKPRRWPILFHISRCVSTCVERVYVHVFVCEYSLTILIHCNLFCLSQKLYMTLCVLIVQRMSWLSYFTHALSTYTTPHTQTHTCPHTNTQNCTCSQLRRVRWRKTVHIFLSRRSPASIYLHHKQVC